MSEGESTARIGIDLRDDGVYAARVERSGGRPQVKGLVRFERGVIPDHQLFIGGKMVVSIPDREVMVKKLKLQAGGLDYVTRGTFELAQSLLESESQFRFDILPTARESHYLGLVIRRERLADQVRERLEDSSIVENGVTCQVRAIGLAHGYRAFCSRVGGDLVAVADFGRAEVSIAFLYKGAVIDLAHLDIGGFDVGEARGRDRLGIELKTMLNFKISELFQDGISVPLSALVITGDEPGVEMMEVLSRYFPRDIRTAQVNPAYFGGETDPAVVPVGRYLVALGLAVE